MSPRRCRSQLNRSIGVDERQRLCADRSNQAQSSTPSIPSAMAGRPIQSVSVSVSVHAVILASEDANAARTL
jgi:hypothetical protein